MNTLGTFATIFYKVGNFCGLLFAFLQRKNPFIKGSTLKGKKIAPKLFPFRADPFQEGCKISIYGVASENVPIPLNLIITLKALYSIF